MRAVLMSMKPEWWEKILSGEKTLEIRKSAPQSKDGRAFRWPLTVLVYVSGTGAVQGKFTCWGVGQNQPAGNAGGAVRRFHGGPAGLRKRREPLRVGDPVPGEIQHPQPAGGVWAEPPAHVVAVGGDPERGGGVAGGH